MSDGPLEVPVRGLYDDGATKVNAINAAEDHLAMLRTDLADHRRLIIEGLTTYKWGGYGTGQVRG